MRSQYNLCRIPCTGRRAILCTASSKRIMKRAHKTLRAKVRKMLCERFQREAGLAVCGEAENGKEAIEKAQQLRPELIVLDLSMPVMNGLDAARILRRLMPSVPLIMYSAFGNKLIERQARLIGIRALVSKSQDAAVLISKARSLLTPRAA